MNGYDYGGLTFVTFPLVFFFYLHTLTHSCLYSSFSSLSWASHETFMYVWTYSVIHNIWNSFTTLFSHIVSSICVHVCMYHAGSMNIVYCVSCICLKYHCAAPKTRTYILEKSEGVDGKQQHGEDEFVGQEILYSCNMWWTLLHRANFWPLFVAIGT